jgi:hypothetical protein
MPPPEWGAGLHSKHLRNLYIYFWRWATWKVYDHGPGNKNGIVCYITVAGFLSGLGFQKMRDYLRRTCDDIWVIDCSPEGHQPGVNTRIFQGVQQPVCIVLASRSAKNNVDVPAKVRFQALPSVPREQKFQALGAIKLESNAWVECPSDWRAPFLPASLGAWGDYPKLEELFAYNGAGVQPKRTWVIAPDSESLIRRWQKLIDAPVEQKELLFHATLRNGQPADRHIRSIVKEAIPGYQPNLTPIIAEKGACLPPVPYGFRSFNRQWIIPDIRVITQPTAELWGSRSDRQIYLTAFLEESPSSGPALTFTGLVPDLHHYKGSFGGRAFPLWRDAKATEPNLPPKLLPHLSQKFGHYVSAEDFLAYIAAVAAHPGFTARFQDDLSTPGLRIPITTDWVTFADAANVGRIIIWLHTFGERMADVKVDRPQQPPRLPVGRTPRIPAAGAISQSPAAMADTIDYDPISKRLLVGQGYIENVEPGMWNYEVSGKQVLLQWFSYRKAHRERPIIGDRRTPSPLGDIQPTHWLAEYTTELINVLNVLGWLVDLEPKQDELLDRICTGPLISGEELRSSGILEVPAKPKGAKKAPAGPDLFGNLHA